MPKGKGKGAKINFGKSHVDDEIDAYEYAEEDAAYEKWEEEQVKENKLAASTTKKLDNLWDKPFVPLAERKVEEAPKPAEDIKEPPKPIEEEEGWQDKEVVLETFDNWEDAMDALDDHMSKQEEAKVATATSKNEGAKGKGK